jgi:hypothetical protein
MTFLKLWTIAKKLPLPKRWSNQSGHTGLGDTMTKVTQRRLAWLTIAAIIIVTGYDISIARNWKEMALDGLFSLLVLYAPVLILKNTKNDRSD